MISWLSLHRKSIFAATTAVFLIGMFVGMGGNLFISRDASGAVAEVQGVKLPYSVYQTRVRQTVDAMRDRGSEVTEALEKQVKDELLRDMIVEEIFAQKGAEMGLKVSDLELAADIQQTFRRGGAFDQGAYFQAVVTQLHMSPEQYEEQRRRSLLGQKYRRLITSAIKVDPAEVEALAAKSKVKAKDLPAERERVAARMYQERSFAVLNLHLRQLSAQLDVKSYLDAREKGL